MEKLFPNITISDFKKMLRLPLVIEIIIFSAIAYFFPKISIFYMICGLLDFTRNRPFSIDAFKRYFLIKGLPTWLLSPFNLFIDLITYKNLHIYQYKDLSNPCQKEISYLLEILKNRPNLFSEFNEKMRGIKRGMIFFKWYGENITESSIVIPEFQQTFNYVSTIGISIFNKNQVTSPHYGPLRITLRVLYNLTPLHDDNIYIEVNNHKHAWHENPLFIFDDTLLHKSVNQSNQIRYCLFVDVLRETHYPKLLRFLLKLTALILFKSKKFFYRNWSFI